MGGGPAVLSLTRRYRFSAGHRLCRPEWSEARNIAVYGRCANPAGHGHNYVMYVTVSGNPDPLTGMLIELPVLDRLVQEKILDRLDHRFLNREVEEFQHTVPTSENLCREIGQWLQPLLAPVRLARITLYETDSNCFELDLRSAAGSRS
jgi:6-pyruvoyltetrahydropterin/6-carboxytetrahydropterin synthase